MSPLLMFNGISRGAFVFQVNKMGYDQARCDRFAIRELADGASQGEIVASTHLGTLFAELYLCCLDGRTGG